ncbi:MAG: O-antigen ligase family protein [Anaerolineales bacterium]|nr:O-antigen ligase family protein [Anaerolineales bacterium]
MNQDNPTYPQTAFKFTGILGLLTILAVVTSYQPLAGLVLILVLVYLGLAYLVPEKLAWLGLFSVALSPQYVVGAQGLFGIETSSIHKLVILAALLPYTLKYGFREKFNSPILVYSLILVWTYFIPERHPNLGSLQPIKSFLGLTLGWFVYMLKWSPKRKYLRSLAWLALVNIAVGVLLYFLGIRGFYATDFTGGFRLNGSSIAAHLAMLAWIGTAVSMGEVARGKRQYLWLGLANFAIILATGTRGATLGALFIFLPYGLESLQHFFQRGRVARAFLLLGLAALLVAVVAMPNFLRRTFIDNSGAINTSGRYDAWEFFITEGQEAPWLGRGFGAGTVANVGQVNSAFRVPHNEYIRMFVDGGLFGAALVLGSFILTFRHILRNQTGRRRSALLFMLLGFAVYSFFDNTLSTTQFSLPFFWYLGIQQSEAWIARGRRQVEENNER